MWAGTSNKHDKFENSDGDGCCAPNFHVITVTCPGIYISDSLLVEVSDSVGEMGLFCFYFALLAFFAFRAPTWFTACGVTWLSDFAY